jgi:hypothetical protein
VKLQEYDRANEHEGLDATGPWLSEVVDRLLTVDCTWLRDLLNSPNPDPPRSQMPILVRATSSIRPVPRSLSYITRLDEESGFGLDLAPTLFGHSFSRVLLRPINRNHALVPIPLPPPSLSSPLPSWRCR